MRSILEAEGLSYAQQGYLAKNVGVNRGSMKNIGMFFVLNGLFVMGSCLILQHALEYPIAGVNYRAGLALMYTYMMLMILIALGECVYLGELLTVYQAKSEGPISDEHAIELHKILRVRLKSYARTPYRPITRFVSTCNVVFMVATLQLDGQFLLSWIIIFLVLFNALLIYGIREGYLTMIRKLTTTQIDIIDPVVLPVA